MSKGRNIAAATIIFLSAIFGGPTPSRTVEIRIDTAATVQVTIEA